MRVSRFLLVVAGMIGVQACTADSTGHPTTFTNPPLAYIRYINAVSDTFNMDFRAIDQVEFSQPFLNVAYRGLGDGNFQGWQAGSRHIRVFPNMSITTSGVAVDPLVVSQVLIDTTFSFTAGQYYTIIHTGQYRAGGVKAKLWIINDAQPAQGSGIAVRVLHAGANQPNVDVWVTDGAAALAGAATISNMSFGTAQAYQARALGATNVKLTNVGDATTAVGSASGYTMGAGTVGSTLADPLGGSGVAGTIATAFIFGPSVTGSKAAAAATASVVWFMDKQPPRTTSP